MLLYDPNNLDNPNDMINPGWTCEYPHRNQRQSEFHHSIGADHS